MEAVSPLLTLKQHCFLLCDVSASEFKSLLCVLIKKGFSWWDDPGGKDDTPSLMTWNCSTEITQQKERNDSHSFSFDVYIRLWHVPLPHKIKHVLFFCCKAFLKKKKKKDRTRSVTWWQSEPFMSESLGLIFSTAGAEGKYLCIGTKLFTFLQFFFALFSFCFSLFFKITDMLNQPRDWQHHVRHRWRLSIQQLPFWQLAPLEHIINFTVFVFMLLFQ